MIGLLNITVILIPLRPEIWLIILAVCLGFLVTISDNFNRTDSTNLGANWTEDNSDYEIETNVVKHISNPGSNYGKLRWIGTALAGDDYDSEVDARSNNSNIGVGAFVRGVTSTTVTFYAFVGFGGDSAYLVEITAGSENIIATGGSFSSSTAVNLRLNISGSNMEGFQDDVSDVTGSDASLTTGAPGCTSFGFLNSATLRYFDNFLAADLSVAALMIGLPKIHPKINVLLRM